MVRGANNPKGVNQYAGDRRQVPLKLPQALIEQIDDAVGTGGGTRTGFIESACRYALEDSPKSQAIALDPSLLIESLTTSLTLKKSALREELKKKKPNPSQVEQWKSEIDQLENFIETL
jgi:hypothetical protein